MRGTVHLQAWVCASVWLATGATFGNWQGAFYSSVAVLQFYYLICDKTK